ncbi:hypothetical protein A6A06_25610 [Streptomyces sp. CB02923]|uniref:hypothetical protein n=1 Tax=Streptomyces sp. CB02923 TaxID=1718985 RepID=UPI00093F19EC|nr:hypothetical protein [Streptomyces sp. CB02923]OKH98981.1 hypothetical protein A6A06_25610 [Streptomyces sp. CB02923]
MDPITLAAASALVGAMVTDGWQQARDATLALWHRIRPEQDETIATALRTARSTVLTARERGEADREQALVGSWRLRLQDLLDQDPALAGDLRRLVDEHLAPALPAAERTRVRTLVQSARAEGRSQVNQSGRDLTIHQAPPP